MRRYEEVTQGLEDGSFVRLKLISLTARPKVITVKLDLHYWPTWQGSGCLGYRALGLHHLTPDDFLDFFPTLPTVPIRAGGYFFSFREAAQDEKGAADEHALALRE